MQSLSPAVFEKNPNAAVSWDGEGWKVGRVQHAIPLEDYFSVDYPKSNALIILQLLT